MSLFKNGVGRPSNETIKKRKMAYGIIAAVVLTIVLGGGYLIFNSFSSKPIEGLDRNAVSAKPSKFVVQQLSNNCFKVFAPTKAQNWRVQLSYNNKVYKTINYYNHRMKADTVCFERQKTNSEKHKLEVKWTKGANNKTHTSPIFWNPSGWLTNILTGWAFKSYNVSWVGTKYTVSFDANGGKISTNNMTVKYGEPYGNLPIPTKDGYVFDGWYTSSSGGSKVTSGSKVNVASDHKLYASWVKVEEVNMKSAGCTNVTSMRAGVYYIEIVGGGAGGVGIKNYEGGNAARWAGYVYLPASTTAKVCVGSGSAGVHGSTTITSLAPGMNVNTVKNGDSSYIVDSSGKKLIEAMGGITYKGPYNSAVTKFSNGAVAKLVCNNVAGKSSKDMKVKYGYGGSKSDPIGTYGKASSGTSGMVSFKYISSLDIWNSSPMKCPSEPVCSISDCGWEGAKVKVYFDPAGGKISQKEMSVAYGKPYGNLPTPTREGFRFGGWYTGTNGSGTNITANTTVTGNLTVYAKWIAIKYTIVYNANGGTGTMASTTCEYGRNCILRANSFTRTGYEFKGWATSSTGEVAYPNGATVSNLSSNVILYAVWGQAISDTVKSGCKTETLAAGIYYIEIVGGGAGGVGRKNCEGGNAARWAGYVYLPALKNAQICVGSGSAGVHGAISLTTTGVAVKNGNPSYIADSSGNKFIEAMGGITYKGPYSDAVTNIGAGAVTKLVCNNVVGKNSKNIKVKYGYGGRKESITGTYTKASSGTAGLVNYRYVGSLKSWNSSPMKCPSAPICSENDCGWKK